MVTLCLAAIDAHLCKRPRLAFAMLVLASLGRPEAWVFAGLYAMWAWLEVPRMRLYTLTGLLLIPALWFVIPALTSKSWFSPGDLALHSIKPSNVIHGNKFTGVISRFSSLYGLPVQLTALFGGDHGGGAPGLGDTGAGGGGLPVDRGRDRLRAARMVGSGALPVRARRGHGRGRRRHHRTAVGLPAGAPVAAALRRRRSPWRH